MNKTFAVFKNELITTITRRSFIITLLIVPLMGIIVGAIVSSLGAETGAVVGQIFGSSQPEQVTEGVVDHSGLLRPLPTGIPADRFILYDTAEEARQALNQEQVDAFYVIEEDYVQTGKVLYIRPEFNPLSGFDQSGLLRSILADGLLKSEPGLAQRVAMPLDLEMVSLNPEPQREESNMLTFFLPYIVMMLFYIIIMTASGLMLNSITKEKQNRVLEILMTSITPTQLLTGKIIALGLVGLLQTMVWSGTGLALLRISGSSMNLSSAFQLPVSILAWGALFFVLGYAVYASLMAGVGALVPNLREASQATTVVIIPMIIPLMLIGAIIDNPNGPLAVTLSLIPFTAPTTMMTRLAAGSVPLWQLLASVAILLVTALILVRAVAGMFRAQTLLSGQEFKMKRFFAALTGRA